MKKRIITWGTISVSALLVVVLMSGPGLAAPLQQARSVITYPSEGMTVSGVVEIQGIATHPNINSYQLRYAAGPQPTGDSQWVDFAIVEGTQVENGVLATWDTTTLPDGMYTLALAVWGADDAASPYVFFVRNLTVNNAQPAPSPTSEQEEEPAVTETPEPAPTAVIGPTPTPVTVEQPPTATAQPSPTGGVDEEEGTAAAPVGEMDGDDEDGLSLPINTEEIKSAFYQGGKIALALFVLWGGYIFIKALIRWGLRQNIAWPWR